MNRIDFQAHKDAFYALATIESDNFTKEYDGLKCDTAKSICVLKLNKKLVINLINFFFNKSYVDLRISNEDVAYLFPLLKDLENKDAFHTLEVIEQLNYYLNLHDGSNIVIKDFILCD